MAGKQKKIQKAPKILPHKHSGRITHHRHTSYESLLAILIIAALLVFGLGNSFVSAQSAAPVTDSTDNYAVVAEAAPSSAPEITSIRDGLTFTSAEPIQIAGRCASGMIVKIFKNQVLAGSTLCRSGLFSIQADLFIGANSIVARAHNLSNKSGPDSTPINVRLILDGRGTVSDPINPFGGPADQLFISSEQSHIGFKPSEEFKLPISVNGGRAPYAVNISWGDRTTDLISRSQAGIFDVKHIYKESGVFQVVLSITDQLGNKAKLELVAVSGGVLASTGTEKSHEQNSGALFKLTLQLLAVLILVIGSFWLGEKREAYMLKKRFNLA